MKIDINEDKILVEISVSELETWINWLKTTKVQTLIDMLTG